MPIGTNSVNQSTAPQTRSYLCKNLGAKDYFLQRHLMHKVLEAAFVSLTGWTLNENMKTNLQGCGFTRLAMAKGFQVNLFSTQ